jgi:hypothetical protein
MAAGVIIVVVIAVGLPLLAWWIGGRPFWNRSYGQTHGELFRDIMRRHGLRPGEMAQVEGAATWGRRLDDPRLRAAVVDWATSMQARIDDTRARHPWRRGLALLLIVVWAGALVATAVHSAAAGEWDRIVTFLVIALFGGWTSGKAAGGPRRAIRLNSEQAADEPGG